MPSRSRAQFKLRLQDRDRNDVNQQENLPKKCGLQFPGWVCSVKKPDPEIVDSADMSSKRGLHSGQAGLLSYWLDFPVTFRPFPVFRADLPPGIWPSA
jgi:hypothetical protein